MSTKIFQRFYATRLGRKAAIAIKDTLPELSGSVLGAGFVAPFMATRVVLMPALADEAANNITCSEEAWPIASQTSDAIIMAHWLEFAQTPKAVLQEAWRCLKAEGLVVLILPNTLGRWAGNKRTPFGQGRAFTQSEISAFLEEAKFDVATYETALFFPPINQPLFLKTAGIWEKAGRFTLPWQGGVWVVAAKKRIYAEIPIPVTEARIEGAMAV